MAKIRYSDPSLAPVLFLTSAMAALAEPRRLGIFNALVRIGKPVGFKALQQQLRTPPASLSRILHRFEDAKLVTMTTNLDRSVTVEINTTTLYRVTRYLFDAHAKLVPHRGSDENPSTATSVAPT